MSEFESDLKKFRLLNILLTRYKDDRGKRERLILNYFVILQNCFGAKMTPEMLRYKIHPDNRVHLETYMMFLNFTSNPSTEPDLSLLKYLETL